MDVDIDRDLNAEDIFNLTDLSDCPKELQEDIYNIRDYEAEPQYKYVYSLFLIKETLTKDELQVGFYRKYGVYLERNKLQGTIAHLRYKNWIKSVKHGVYRRTSSKLNIKELIDISTKK